MNQPFLLIYDQVKPYLEMKNWMTALYRYRGMKISISAKKTYAVLLLTLNGAQWDLTHNLETNSTAVTMAPFVNLLYIIFQWCLSILCALVKTFNQNDLRTKGK